VFFVAGDGRMYSAYWNDGSPWSIVFSIGGFFPAGSPVAAVARVPNHLDLFVVGNDGRVYTSWWQDGSDWTGRNDNWEPIGGFFPPGTQVTAVARTPNHLDLFVVGNDGRVYTSWWQDGSDWTGRNDNWDAIGGFFPAAAPVSAVARTPDHLDLFVVGNDGRVYTSWWQDGSDWTGRNDSWEPIGGFFPAGAPVSAIARTPDHLDLFVVGNDGRVYTSWWQDGSDWTGRNDNWDAIGGFFPAGAPVAAVARVPNHLDLFVVGNDGRVYTSWWQDGSDWTGRNDNWDAIGGFFPAGASISAVARTPDHIDLFVVGNDEQVYTSWWQDGSDWTGRNDNWIPLVLIGTNFTFDQAITPEQINTLLERHQFAHSRIMDCTNLDDSERQLLSQTYRRAIHHGINTNPNANASVPTLGSSRINVNFTVLFPQGAVEIAQTLIHEMMHCAGFDHPNRRVPPAAMPCPNPMFDCPFDGGPYYGTAPLRAEMCIAGSQDDMMDLVRRKAGEESCVLDETGRWSIHRI
jgi:hypothetical protein